MASVEFIQKRIEGAKKQLETLKKKLARIEKAEASGWEINPYYYSESDKRSCLKEITYTEEQLKKYEDSLVSEQQKAASRDVKVIIDFLEAWKKRVYEFYKSDLEAYYEEKDAVNALHQTYSQLYWEDKEIRQTAENAYTEARKALYCKLYGYTEKREFTNRWGKQDYTTVKVRDGEWEHLRIYVEAGKLEDALKKLEKHLEQEKNRKYDFIIERTNKIVGQITDASQLHIGAKDDLNGFIKGTKGVAKVQTIGAGGYNTDTIVNVKHGQVFHFRTLITEVK